jgi:predicted transcriptional regulator
VGPAVVAPGTTASDRSAGLGLLRRSGAVTELLFLHECATREVTQLKPVAQRLGLTVQAASHIFRQLRRRGLGEVRNGLYRPTVAGIAWLHAALGSVREDLDERLQQLHVIRSTRAVARGPIFSNARVVLEVRRGVLEARAGSKGPSRGRARRAARNGQLVDVVDLEGIVSLRSADIRIVTLPDADALNSRLLGQLRRLVRASPEGLLAASGIEAYHWLQRATPRPVLRYAVAASAIEASKVGVPTTLVVLESDLPRLLARFDQPQPSPITVERLRG